MEFDDNSPLKTPQKDLSDLQQIFEWEKPESLEDTQKQVMRKFTELLKRSTCDTWLRDEMDTMHAALGVLDTKEGRKNYLERIIGQIKSVGICKQVMITQLLPQNPVIVPAKNLKKEWQSSGYLSAYCELRKRAKDKLPILLDYDHLRVQEPLGVGKSKEATGYHFLKKPRPEGFKILAKNPLTEVCFGVWKAKDQGSSFFPEKEGIDKTLENALETVNKGQELARSGSKILYSIQDTVLNGDGEQMDQLYVVTCVVIGGEEYNGGDDGGGEDGPICTTMYPLLYFFKFNRDRKLIVHLSNEIPLTYSSNEILDFVRRDSLQSLYKYTNHTVYDIAPCIRDKTGFSCSIYVSIPNHVASGS
mmetsp:Transcript_11033/g.18052  ORF Transcript_11033/g.18052 Transcript_11033/m.18052 type:complete len:361 (+) Transcript_11033:391-1473(+)